MTIPLLMPWIIAWLFHDYYSMTNIQWCQQHKKPEETCKRRGGAALLSYVRMYGCVCVCVSQTGYLLLGLRDGRPKSDWSLYSVTVFEQAALSHALTLLNLALEASGIALTNTATASSRAVETRSFKSGWVSWIVMLLCWLKHVSHVRHCYFYTTAWFDNTCLAVGMRQPHRALTQ